MRVVIRRARNLVAMSLIRRKRAIILRAYQKTAPVRSFDRVTIVANFSFDNGISRGAKYQFKALQALIGNVSILDIASDLDDVRSKEIIENSTMFVFHCGGPETANLIWKVMPGAAGAYKVAYWAWELPEPPRWTGYDALVDEIWTPSEFSRASIARMSDRPVHVVPHTIKAQTNRRKPNAGIFKVLVMADSRSSFSRKNPAAAIRAFKDAFADSPTAHLYVKLLGRRQEIASFVQEMEIENCHNISIITERLSNDEMIELFKSVDVLLSLHRAEGFGLPMLEAMSCGTPVVATAWSGNLEFMNETNSYLVDYDLIAVQDKYLIYDFSEWADPNVATAASILKDLRHNPDRLEAMSSACYKSILDTTPKFPLTSPARERATAEM